MITNATKSHLMRLTKRLPIKLSIQLIRGMILIVIKIKLIELFLQVTKPISERCWAGVGTIEVDKDQPLACCVYVNFEKAIS